MHIIRPYKLFTIVQGSPMERLVQVPIPSRKAFGGLTLLETFALIAAARLVSARRIFEFGTFRGGTALNLALNTPEDAQIFTIDLGEDHLAEVIQNPPDALATQIHLASLSQMDFMGSPVAGKINTLIGNSILYDFSQYRRSMDLVFIDGGHDIDTLSADTRNAFEMVRIDVPSCVAWHDYGSQDYEGLNGYVDDLSKERPIFHIGDSMLCMWFNDPENSITPRLLEVCA